MLVPSTIEKHRNRHYAVDRLVDSTNAYWPGDSRSPVLAISPDDRWMLYAVDSPSPIREPSFWLLDLSNGDNRVVSFGEMRNREDELSRLGMNMGDVSWTTTHAYARGFSIDLQARTATRSGPPQVVCETRVVDRRCPPELLATQSRSHGRLAAGVWWIDDWRDSVPGDPTYFTKNVSCLGGWSSYALIERLRVDGSTEILHVRRGVLSGWSILDASLSPDGRFLAYRANRDVLPIKFATLMSPVPLYERYYLFIYDLKLGSEHLISHGHPYSLFWSADSRRLYFVDRDMIGNISVVRIAEPNSQRMGVRTVQPAPTQRFVRIDSSENEIHIRESGASDVYRLGY